VKPVLVKFPDGLVNRIDAVRGDANRSEFIRRCVEHDVAARERGGQPLSEKAPWGAPSPIFKPLRSARSSKKDDYLRGRKT
jgi:hypothetical protein